METGQIANCHEAIGGMVVVDVERLRRVCCVAANVDKVRPDEVQRIRDDAIDLIGEMLGGDAERILVLLEAATTEVRRLKTTNQRLARRADDAKKRADYWIQRCARWEARRGDVLVVAGAINDIVIKLPSGVDKVTESLAMGLLQDFRDGPPARVKDLPAGPSPAPPLQRSVNGANISKE